MGKEKQMKHPQQIVPVGTKTTFADVWQWGQELERLHARIARRFARPEPRRRCLAYLKGIVSSIQRKNVWQLAEHAGEARPDGMQRLLNHAIWDEDLVRDDLRAYVLEHLGDPGAIVVIDAHELSQAWEQIRWCRTTRLWHHQAGGKLPGWVFLAYASAKGCTLLDRELYLPMRWTEDRERCQEAGIPDTVDFQTTPELAKRMLERLNAAQVPIAWVVAD